MMLERSTMAPINLPYLSFEIDRHRNARAYVRRFGRRVRIKEVPGSPAFLDAYKAALALLEPKAGALTDPITEAEPGTFGAMALAYLKSAEFHNLKRSTQVARRLVIEHCLREPYHIDDPKVRMADVPLKTFGTKHIRVLRDRKSDKPGAAKNRIKFISVMFAWAIEADYEGIAANPARDVKPIKHVSDGFHTWTVDEVATFEAFYPVGTRARLALALLLYTGARRSDVVKFGRQHVKAGKLRYVPTKTEHVRPRPLTIPFLSMLSEVIAQSPTGDLTYLITEHGRPFTAAGFGNWFGDCCAKAGVPGRAHGLRKAGATILAQRGATAHELMAIYGWATVDQTTTYTRAVDQERLAGALHRLDLSHPENDTPDNATSMRTLRQTQT
jgi:integrase